VKARRAASVALIGALLFGTSGCTLFAIQGTLVQYQPSDGTTETIGDVQVTNAIALSADGQDVSLLMTLINTGDAKATVNFQVDDASGARVTIPVIVAAHSSTSVGASDSPASAVFREVGVQVGSLLPVYVQYGDVQGKQMSVPVLDGSTAAYSTLLPTPLPSVTPTLVPTAVPEPTETPAP
jgi:hypothetical protein